MLIGSRDIKIKGNKVTFYGEAYVLLKRAAKDWKVSPQRAFNRMLRDAIKRHKQSQEINKRLGTDVWA